MALVNIGGGGGYDPRTRQAMAAQLIGQSFGQFNQQREIQKKQAEQDKAKALAAQLFGGVPAQQGAGLQALAKQHAPGFDPSTAGLTGPSLALTKGGMAKPAVPGLLESGKLLPEHMKMVQSYLLQGGDLNAIKSFLPEPMTAYQQGSLGLQEKQLAQGDKRLEVELANMSADNARADRSLGLQEQGLALQTQNAEASRAIQQQELALRQAEMGLRRENFATEQEYNQARLGIEQAKLQLEQQKAAAGPEPMSTLGKVGHDLGIDIRTPEGLEQAMKAMQAGATQINMPSPVSGPAATIQSQAPGALQDIAQIRAQLLDPQSGALNRGTVASMNAPVIGSLPGQGTQLRAQMEGAMDTMVRVRTGAAATPDEMANMRATYMPGPLDDAATAADKLSRLDRDLRSALGVAGVGHPGAPQAPVPPPAASPAAPPDMVDQLLQSGSGLVQQFLGGGGQPQGAQEPMQPAAPIIVNPQTGQRMTLRNGQWVPL